MSKRTFILAVTGLAFSVAACGSYGTSVVEVSKTAARVASVSLTVPLSLITGQTMRAVAIPKDASGAPLPDRPVSWFTSSASVASVTDSGLISAVAPGTAVVSAVSEGVSGQATMAVIPPTPTPIATLTVAVSPSSVLTGQTAHATATLLDSSGRQILGRPITWQSSKSTVAAVAPTGDVAALTPGTAMISASIEGKSASSALTVNAPPSIPVASVSVSPASASLLVGASVQLSAVTRDANNNVLTGRVIGWSSANTAIAGVSASGLVTAVAGGSVSITVSSEGQTAVAAIAVSAPAPAPVATVSVSPTSSSLLVGNTVQLSATMRDANNNVLTGRVVTWSSANTNVASVNPTSGLVTAVDTGSATITATSETKTGTATVNVLAPPPPGSTNEPSGMTLISERPFNSLSEDPSWLMFYFTLASDATAPRSPSSVIRATYPTGFQGGVAPANAEKAFPGRRVLYLSYWAKLSPNFWGHLTGVNKQIYTWAAGSPIFFIETHGIGSGGLTPEVVLQGGTVSDATYTPNLVPGARVPRGQWYNMEVVLTGNSSGSADGSVDWWLDGVHVGSRSGLVFTSGATSWTQINFRPIWGGIGDSVPATMTLDMDHLYLSGKN